MLDNLLSYLRDEYDYNLLYLSDSSLYFNYLKYCFINHFNQSEILTLDNFSIKVEEYSNYILRRDAF